MTTPERRPEMLKAAIVGCGKIADAHASAISMIPDSEIVAVCDREELMAKQLFERFKIGAYFHDLVKMLERSKPNVVHITTPPQSHFEIGRICLESGCHVYIEKPFTLNSGEAERLIELANQKGLRLTVGTDEQYTHVAVNMRKLIADGYIGGPPIHMEVHYGYDLGDGHYAKSFLGNNSHWLRSLPGQLMHNLISHGIARIAEYLPGEAPTIIAHGFTSDFLRKLGENQLIDELRVIIDDGGRTTAYFTFSTQIRPLLKEFRIFGSENGLIVNHDQHSLIKVPGKIHKSYLNTVVPLRYYAGQYRKSVADNVKLFLKREFHLKAGLKKLIELFYESISTGTAVPISYKEILLTTKIMDSIFAQVYRNS
jgi:predicted dehydrogenase